MVLQVRNLARLTAGQKQAVSDRAAAIRRGEIGLEVAQVQSTQGSETLERPASGRPAR